MTITAEQYMAKGQKFLELQKRLDAVSKALYDWEIVREYVNYESGRKGRDNGATLTRCLMMQARACFSFSISGDETISRGTSEKPFTTSSHS